MIVLTDNNYLVYCLNHYSNPQCCSFEEFKNDLGRIKAIKRLLLRLKYNNENCVRLLLNQLIILHNVFGLFSVTILLFKLDEEYHSIINTLLSYLHIIKFEPLDELTMLKIKEM